MTTEERAELVALALRANADPARSWMYLNDVALELADVLEAGAELRERGGNTWRHKMIVWDRKLATLEKALRGFK